MDNQTAPSTTNLTPPLNGGTPPVEPTSAAPQPTPPLETSAPNFSGSDVPPIPGGTPSGNMPPPEILSASPTNPAAVPPVAAPPSRRSFLPKKLLILLGLIVFAVLAVFLAISILSPRLQGNKKVSLTWWGLWEDDTLIAPLIEEYTRTNPNVEIKYVRQAKEDYRERLTNALAREDGPDLFRFHNTWVPMFRTKLFPIPTSVMSAQEYAQTFYPVAVSDMTLGTGIVGLPLMYEGLALYVNDDIFATYGKNVPTTWYELRDTAIELTIKDDKDVITQAGAALGRTENVDNWQDILALMMIQNGANLAKPTGEVAEQALRFYTAFSEVYNVWDETLPNSTIAFAGGKVAMMIAPSWRAHEILEQNPRLKFHVVPVPQLPKDQPDDPDITYASYWVEGVNTQSENKEEAWKFLKFVSSKESLEKMYTAAKSQRAFGELYPRRDMQQLLLSDPYTSGFISVAPNAKSFFIASRTFDGQTGINSQLSKYLEDAVNTVNARTGGNDFEGALNTASAGFQTVLVQFGLIAAPPAVKK